MQITTGTVRNFNDDSGWGWIALDEPVAGGDSAFVHFSAIRAPHGERRTLVPGMRVRFRLVDAVRGLRAADVVVTGMSSGVPREVRECR